MPRAAIAVSKSDSDSTPATATGIGTGTATPAKLLLSVAQASDYSGLSTKRIRHLVNTGQVRCVRHSEARNAHMNVVRASLDEWIDEQSR